MRLHAAAAGLAVTGAIAVVVACSGKTADTSSSSGSSGTSGSSGGTATKCPSAVPKQNDACSTPDVTCEWGDDWDPRCNTIYVCSAGRWAIPFVHGNGTPTCGSKGPPTLAGNPPDCAPTADAVPSGTVCSSTSKCSYDGASCSCGVQCPSYPIQPPPCTDGGSNSQNCCDQTHKWGCFTGPKYCTAGRPHVGDTCAKEGDSCAIDPPAECGDLDLICTKGVWSLPNTECPVSTAKAKKEIAYLDRAAEDRLHDDLMSVGLATYRYKDGEQARHLGFVIEDMPPGSPAVLQSESRVDLYGYTSMTVASLKHQQREIDELRAEVRRLAEENARLRTR